MDDNLFAAENRLEVDVYKTEVCVCIHTSINNIITFVRPFDLQYITKKFLKVTPALG